MATFYIQLQDKLLQISGELTAENISNALGYVPVDSSTLNNYATKDEVSSLIDMSIVEELSQKVNNITFDSLKDNPFLQDGSGELNIVDEAGNIIAKVNSDGIHSVDFIAREHKLSEKADKSDIPSLDGYATEAYVNTNLQNYATKDEISDLVDMSIVEELQGKVNTLVGEDSDKSVRTIANEELAALLLVGNDNLQSLQELAAWIDEHPEDASAMNEAIQTNTSNIAKLDSAYKEADTKVLTDANEYTDNINFYTVKDNPIVNGETGSLTFVDETGYIGLKVTEDGIIAKDVVTPEHKLSDKANTSDIPTKVSQLQNDANYITTADIPVLDEYVTETELNDKGYLTEHLDISHLAEKSEIPSLDGYATEQWVEDKNYLTEHLDIAHLASKEELNNIDFYSLQNNPVVNTEEGRLLFVDESGNIGLQLEADNTLYVKDVVGNGHILSSKQDTLVSGSTIKTINGESILGEGNLTVTTEANIQAVDTTDEIEDVETNTYVKYVALTLTDELKALVRENIGVNNQVTVDLSNYYTKKEINTLLGDINTILESIIGITTLNFPILLLEGDNGEVGRQLYQYVITNAEDSLYTFKSNEDVSFSVNGLTNKFGSFQVGEAIIYQAMLAFGGANFVMTETGYVTINWI